MDKKQWQKLEELVSEATDLEPQARRAFLEQACADNATLLEEAWELVSTDEELTDFMAKPLPLSLAEAVISYE